MRRRACVLALLACASVSSYASDSSASSSESSPDKPERFPILGLLTPLFSTDTPQPDSPPSGFRPKPTSPPSFTPVPTRTWPESPSPTTGTPSPTTTGPAPAPWPAPTPSRPKQTPSPEPSLPFPDRPVPTPTPPSSSAPAPSPTRPKQPPGSPEPTTDTPEPSGPQPPGKTPVPPVSPSPPVAIPRQPSPSPSSPPPPIPEPIDSPASPAPPPRNPPPRPNPSPAPSNRSPSGSSSSSSGDISKPSDSSQAGSGSKEDSAGFQPRPSSSGQGARSPPSQGTKGDSATPVPTRRRYERGDQIIIVQTGTIDTNGSAVSDGALKAVILNPSRIPAVVIGGSETTADTRTLQQVSGRDVYRFLQVLTSVLALLSCLALIVFHFAAADGRLMSIWAPESPNAWEFVLYIGYIQRMASLSHLVVRRVPYFLWNYADNFSWTVFVPFHSSSVQPASRRLYEVVVLDGVVGFANRIGVSEGGLLVRSMIGLLVVFGIVAVVIGITTAVTKPRDVYDPDDELEITRSSSVVSTPKIREATSNWRIKSELPVLVWLVALYPMAMLSSFEIGMEICAHDVTAFSLVVAIVALLFGCAGIFVYRVVVILKTRMQQIDDNVSDDSTDTCLEEPLHTQPLPFLAFVITQIVSGIVVGAVTNAIAQIVALVVFVLVFLLCAWRWMQWRNTRVTKALVFGLGLIKIVNLGLIFAFVSSSDDAAISDGPHAVGIAYIVLNSVVIVGFFVRHFGMANRLARIVWDERSRIRKATQPISDDSSDRPAYTSIASTPAHSGLCEQSAV